MNRRLYRSRTDTVLGGVAAGLADYVNADPALVRIAWAILVLITNGVAFLAYIVAWIVVPQEPAPVVPAHPADGEPVDRTDPDGPVVADDGPKPAAAPSPSRESQAGLIVGIGLILLGVWFLLRDYLPRIDWGLLWPIILIGIGGLILVTTARRRTDV